VQVAQVALVQVALVPDDPHRTEPGRDRYEVLGRAKAPPGIEPAGPS
jgi:hypothetical protein